MRAYKKGKKGNKKIKVREGVVLKEVRILFPVEHGGDVVIETGDVIRIEIIGKAILVEEKK